VTSAVSGTEARVAPRFVAGRDRKPAAIVALARQLDAGLRNPI